MGWGEEKAVLARNNETVSAENAELRMRVEYGRGPSGSGALAAIVAASGGDDPASGRYDGGASSSSSSFSALAGSALILPPPPSSGASPSAVNAQLKYELAARELLDARQENKRLNSYVQQILREIQAKAPLIIEQKKESERVLRKHAALAKQLQTVVAEREDLRIEKAVLVQERMSLRAEAEDLSTQVQVLLRVVQLLESHVDSATVAFHIIQLEEFHKNGFEMGFININEEMKVLLDMFKENVKFQVFASEKEEVKEMKG